MTKQNKTKLQFILGGILVVTFAVSGCNNGKTDKPVTPPAKDTMDTLIGKKAPVTETKPQ